MLKETAGKEAETRNSEVRRERRWRGQEERRAPI